MTMKFKVGDKVQGKITKNFYRIAAIDENSFTAVHWDTGILDGTASIQFLLSDQYYVKVEEEMKFEIGDRFKHKTRKCTVEVIDIAKSQLILKYSDHSKPEYYPIVSFKSFVKDGTYVKLEKEEMKFEIGDRFKSKFGDVCELMNITEKMLILKYENQQEEEHYPIEHFKFRIEDGFYTKLEKEKKMLEVKEGMKLVFDEESKVLNIGEKFFSIKKGDVITITLVNIYSVYFSITTQNVFFSCLSLSQNTFKALLATTKWNLQEELFSCETQNSCFTEECPA